MATCFEVQPCADSPETTDPRIPPRDRVVTRALMERWQRECPDKVFIRFADNGEQWTYRELRELVIQTAIGLQRLGVAQGDHGGGVMCLGAVHQVGQLLWRDQAARRAAARRSG